MLLAASLLPAMNAVAKSLALEFSIWQVVWARFLGHLVWMTLLFAPAAGLALFRTANPRVQLTRSLVFFASNALFIAALPHIELATASAIMFITPIIVTALSGPLLGERVGPWRWGAVAVGFAGALVILRPAGDAFNAWALLTLGSAFCFGFYQIWTRRLATRERPDTLIVYTALLGAITMTLVAPWFSEVPTRAGQWIAFAGLGLLGGLAQYFVIKALQHGPASIISPIGYAELLGAAAFGYLVFGNLPGPATWYGAALIVGAGLFIVHRESRARGRPHR